MGPFISYLVAVVILGIALLTWDHFQQKTPDTPTIRCEFVCPCRCVCPPADPNASRLTLSSEWEPMAVEFSHQGTKEEKR